MWNNGHDAYFETKVLTAEPLELVNLLYRGCTEAVRDARCHLAEGRIVERSRAINKACEIVIELNTALDHKRGGELSGRLALLYDYMLRRLLEANMKQSDPPLEDVLGLLATLAEAWAGIAVQSAGVDTGVDIGVATAPLQMTEAQPVAEEYSWSRPAAETSYSPVSENLWTQPVVENPYSQPVAENPWAQSLGGSPWAQPAAEEAAFSLQG